MKNNCLNCGDRKLMCHSKCITYIEFKKQLDEINKARRDQKDIDEYVIGRAIKVRESLRK